MWINIENLKKECNDFIKNNPELKLSKVIFKDSKKGCSFVLFRKYAPYGSAKDVEYA